MWERADPVTLFGLSGLSDVAMVLGFYRALVSSEVGNLSHPTTMRQSFPLAHGASLTNQSPITPKKGRERRQRQITSDFSPLTSHFSHFKRA